MSETREAAAPKGLRVYQYTNQDGVTFWSFEKLSSAVSPSQTLRMDDRIGTHFDNYVHELRILRRFLIEGEDDEDGDVLG
mgnify:CR=1 FL=1